ncbi:hypothetical protein NBRC110019_14290 [Neptunitalea chrysea]|uniref:Tetratricopeptide repeat-containing protein n=1 Tax=Neptunitalea chrysea TaxID=1647581 RepID=A0A9W6B4G9_9FLAO|nr:tetratricopeptide repeat protein [Neptunitalea chrysea]GLB52389.1 hypothetical protein NBRC110019_14290 [Neptunitalea chrysea]
MKNIIKTTLFLTIAFLSQNFYGQEYSVQFQEYFNAKDTTNQIKVLTAWEKATPKDPELYTSYFNYYFSKAQKEFISLSTDEPQGMGLTLTDSTNQIAGYLSGQVTYDERYTTQAFQKIDEGIKLFPNRLDMRFGKTYALKELKRWDELTDVFIETVTYGNKINNDWLWTENKKLESGKENMLAAIQDYISEMFNTGNDKVIDNMRTISLEVLKYYPNHVESLSNIGTTYLIDKEYENALNYFLKAETINPKDAIVLNNIAYSYQLLENNVKAIEYYKKMLPYVSTETKESIKRVITGLESK